MKRRIVLRSICDDLKGAKSHKVIEALRLFRSKLALFFVFLSRRINKISQNNGNHADDRGRQKPVIGSVPAQRNTEPCYMASCFYGRVIRKFV